MPGAKSEKDLIPPGMEGLLFKERSWVGLGRRRRARPTAKGQCSNDTCKIGKSFITTVTRSPNKLFFFNLNYSENWTSGPCISISSSFFQHLNRVTNLPITDLSQAITSHVQLNTLPKRPICPNKLEFFQHSCW